MENLGTVAMLLLFGAGFALYVGSGGEYAPGFLNFYTAVGSYDINGLINLIFQSITDITTWGIVAVVTALALVNSQSLKYTAGIAVMTAFASLFFTPFTFINGLALPIEIVYLIRGFFNFILMIAVIQFITEKRW